MRTLPRHVPAKSGRNEVSLAQVRPIVAPNRANVIGTLEGAERAMAIAGNPPRSDLTDRAAGDR